jgi:hypothetical protein
MAVWSCPNMAFAEKCARVANADGVLTRIEGPPQNRVRGFDLAWQLEHTRIEVRQHADQALRVVAEGTAHFQLKCGSCKRRQHTGQLVHLGTEQRLAFAFAEPDHADLIRLRVGDAWQRLLDEVFRRRDHRPGHAFVERALHAARECREGATVDAGVYRQRGIESAVGFDRLVGLHAIAK